jgi:serine/threonine protein kinase
MESKKFGRYEIKGEIGRGGMATVYHAYDPRFEREVALKVLPREMLHDPQFRTRFEREAKTIAMLEHPAIVPVYDFGEEDGQPYFVMRYMTGGALTDRMKNGAITIQEAAHLYERLAPALDEAHTKGIIHRDLKPGNILFDQYGEPYISDFGIAKIAAAQQTNVTGSAIIGTPAYMSPEQAQGESIDGRSDIYALGVILFELLTGQQPYHGDTPMSVVVKHITDPIPHILDVMPDLPPDIETIIDKALAKDRELRYPTVKALSTALNTVAQGDYLELESSDKTLVSSSKAATPKPPAGAPRTMMAKREQVPTPLPGAGLAAPRKKTGLWIGLGGGALLVCAVAVAGIFLLKDKLPFLAAPTRTRTPVVAATQTSGASRLTSTVSSGADLPAVASETPAPAATFTPSPSATVQSLPSLGGADLIAFLSDNDISIMGVDGSQPLVQVTKDGTPKTSLQWSPDGKSLFFINSMCIKMISLAGGDATEVTCFPGADNLEAFEISPDGKQVAISMNRALFVVPFDLAAISKAHSWTQLLDMKGCFTYGKVNPNQAPTLGVHWSRDGSKLAINSLSASAGILIQEIRIFDISACNKASPYPLDTFPATRFTMSGYNNKPIIPSFSWDGNLLFVLNSIFRYEVGYLYEYNNAKMLAKTIDPFKTSCCYAMGRFSPDGTYLLFAYQNLLNEANSKMQLYYISYGSIGGGSSYSPLPLPDGFFSVAADHMDAVLRPATP